MSTCEGCWAARSQAWLAWSGSGRLQLGRDSKDTRGTSCPWWLMAFPEPISVCSFIQLAFTECLLYTGTAMGSKTDACPQIAQSGRNNSEVCRQLKCRGKNKGAKGSPGGGACSRGRLPGEGRAGVESQRMKRNLLKWAGILGKENSRCEGPGTQASLTGMPESSSFSWVPPPGGPACQPRHAAYPFLRAGGQVMSATQPCFRGGSRGCCS